jgi:hypothetical protein
MSAGDHQDPVDGGVDDEYPGEKEMQPASHRQPLDTRQGRPRGKRPARIKRTNATGFCRPDPAYPSPRSPLRPISLYTMLVLTYCAGLRLGELARLNLADIDLQVGTITIRETKFFKSRILPLADSALSALREYLEARRKAKMPQNPESGLFWHDQGNVRYTSHTVAGCLVDILRRAGIKPPKGKSGPRIHDLRHSFVVNRILEWYRTGINPQDKLPFLATYLGCVAFSTYAGIPWLRFIRQRLGARVHFWPFDGWDIPAGRSAVVEVYPTLWSRSFANEGRTGDQHDAFSIAAWLLARTAMAASRRS